jgi:hypothetical protein
VRHCEACRHLRVPCRTVGGVPSRLEHVVARNAVQLRRNRGWTQLDLARAMSDVGMEWTPGRAQEVESYGGTLSLTEVLGLCWALGVPLADLLGGEEQVTLPETGRQIGLSAFRDALSGRGAIRLPNPKAADAADVEEVRTKAADLAISPDVFIELCRQRFGRSFRTEREHRAGDLSALRPRSAQVKRGHAGRAVLSELRDHIGGLGGPAQASLLVYGERLDKLAGQVTAFEQRVALADAHGSDPVLARELIDESVRLSDALTQLQNARYISIDDSLLDQVTALISRTSSAQLRVATIFGLHLRTHTADGTPL